MTARNRSRFHVSLYAMRARPVAGSSDRGWPILLTVRQFTVYRDAPAYISLLNLGLMYVLALVIQKLGDKGIKGAIPGGATLVFEVELVNVQ